jgi:hypothetical protein
MISFAASEGVLLVTALALVGVVALLRLVLQAQRRMQATLDQIGFSNDRWLQAARLMREGRADEAIALLEGANRHDAP